MGKREITREKILRKGMELASSIGLMNISIGEMAKATAMSRTGVISHFNDKEDMQMAILSYSELVFTSNVIKKSYVKDPVQNIKLLIENWMNWTGDMGFQSKVSCPFLKASIEFKDYPDSKVRDYLKGQQTRLLNYLADMARRCKEASFFSETRDETQFAYEFYSMYLGHSLQKNLLDEELADERFITIANELIVKYQD